MSNELYLWMDLETTNLRTSGELMEVGAYITLADTDEFMGACSYVITPTYPKDQMKLSKEAEKVHGESGLIEHLMAHSFDIDYVQEDMTEFFGRYGNKGDFILAGREMMWAVRHWLPEISLWFHPTQTMDLEGFSSVLKAAGRAELEPVFEGPRKNRAGPDAQIFFHEFQYYKELLGLLDLDDDKT